MIHLGVDLHQRFCYLTALDARGKQLQAGAVANEAVAFAAILWPVSWAGGGGVRVLAGISRSGGTAGGAVGAGASAAGESDCVGEAAERPGGFGNAGALVAV